MRKLLLLILFMLSFLCVTNSAGWAGGELLLYNWSDYTSPDLISKFEKETGVKVIIDTYDSDETLLSRLRSGDAAYDIAVPSYSVIPRLIADGLLEIINAQKINGFDNIIDSLKNPPWDPQNIYSVPWSFGCTSFSVNTKVYTGDVTSMKVLFEPPRELAGKIGMFDSAEENCALALIYLGLPLCDEDPDEMLRVQDLLLTQKPSVKIYSSERIHQRLLADEVIVTANWSGDSLRTRRQNPDIKFIFPKEGVMGWTDNLVVLKNGKNKENALLFLEFMLRPENAAIQSNFSGFAGGVKGVEAFLNSELRNAPEFSVPDGVRLHFQPICPEKAIRLQNNVWEAVRR